MEPVLRAKTEECVRDGATYRVETRWDDETGCAEIREYTLGGELVRRCDWRIWAESDHRDGQRGEAIWYSPSGAELERRPIRERG